MDIEKALKELDRFCDYESLSVLVAETSEYLSSDMVLEIIPSIVIDMDGPSLKSLFLVSEGLFCEARVPPAEGNHSFDFAHKSSIYNMRVELSSSNGYDIAQVVLIHALDMRSYLYYAGQEREEWLNKVRRQFPLTVLAHIQ